MEKVKDRNNYGAPRFQAKRSTKKIAIVGMLAGLYAVVTVVQGPLAFMGINFRLSNLLISVVPILGWPAVLGISLGVLLGNVASPLGPIDLISALFSFVGLSAIHLLRRRSVLLGLGIYSLLLSLWVSFELMVVTHLPFLPTFYFVLGGIAIVVMGFAYVCYRYLAASGLGKRVGDLV